MRARRVILGMLLMTAILAALGAAKPHRALLGMELAPFEGRDVLVLRTSGGVPVPSVFSRDEAAAEVTFTLAAQAAGGVAPPANGLKLIHAITLDGSVPGKTGVTVKLAAPELTRAECFRLSQPSDHVILFEVFSAEGLKQQAQPISSNDPLLAPPAADKAVSEASTPAAAVPAATAPPTASSADALGIPTVDLRATPATQVLTLAERCGLLKLNGQARIATENMGEVQLKPAAQSIASWLGATPPGELYLIGPEDKLAGFLKGADAAQIAQLPGFERTWGGKQAAQPGRQPGTGPTPAMRSRLKDDPYSGLYYADALPGGSMLSDILVTLPALNGANLYDVLNYLSMISGISLIIDPYTFDEPTGSYRPPKVPDPPQSGDQQPGFRPANQFDPQFINGPGSVMGNFINVPFDAALRLITETNNLEFVVYNSGQPASGARYGRRSSPNGDGEPYQKPVILITSRERLQQELSGTNEIDLYQMHYADPNQVTDMLANFNLLPGTNSGWYIYNNTGIGRGGNGGSGGSGGNNGSQGGGGNRGGAGGGGGRQNNAKLGYVYAYHGSTRQPVEDAVRDALAHGLSAVRVLLPAETDGRYMTMLAQ